MRTSSPDDITACGLVVHAHRHVVEVHGRELELTAREFGILSKLAEHPGWVLSAEQLASDDAESDFSSESVSVLISRLRRKLARAGAREVVETVRGLGYRLKTPPPWAAGRPDESLAALDSLREASWQLQEAVFEVEHAGSDAQRAEAVDALERARRAIYATLAE